MKGVFKITNKLGEILICKSTDIQHLISMYKTCQINSKFGGKDKEYEILEILPYDATLDDISKAKEKHMQLYINQGIKLLNKKHPNIGSHVYKPTIQTINKIISSKEGKEIFRRTWPKSKNRYNATNSRRVKVIDITQNIITEYASIKQASEKLEISPSVLYQHIKKEKEFKGLIIQYA